MKALIVIVPFALALLPNPTFIPTTTGYCQTEQRKQPAIGRGEDGEYNSLLMDAIINETRETGSLIIIISRLGTGDTRANLHRRRLHNAVTRLVEYATPMLRDKVVTAIGERVTGKGKVEFYVNGRLFYVALFKPNADFRMDCCDEVYPNYYPWYKEPKKGAARHRNAS